MYYITIPSDLPPAPDVTASSSSPPPTFVSPRTTTRTATGRGVATRKEGKAMTPVTAAGGPYNTHGDDTYQLRLQPMFKFAQPVYISHTKQVINFMLYPSSTLA